MAQTSLQFRHQQATLLLQLAWDHLILLLSVRLVRFALSDLALVRPSALQASTVQLPLSFSMSMHVQLANSQQQVALQNQAALTAPEVISAEKVHLQTMTLLYVQLKATYVLPETVKEQHVLQVKPQQTV